jgi:hypothetical protein
MGAEMFHADRQTDMTALIVAFRNSTNAPKIIRSLKLYLLKVTVHASIEWSPGIIRVISRQIALPACQ